VLPNPFPIASQVVDQGVVPAGTLPAVAAHAHAAFLSGLHAALLLGAVATLLGAACGPFIKADLSQAHDAPVVHF
jgi:hypothetical protein